MHLAVWDAGFRVLFLTVSRHLHQIELHSVRFITAGAILPVRWK